MVVSSRGSFAIVAPLECLISALVELVLVLLVLESWRVDATASDSLLPLSRTGDCDGMKEGTSDSTQDGAMDADILDSQGAEAVALLFVVFVDVLPGSFTNGAIVGASASRTSSGGSLLMASCKAGMPKTRIIMMTTMVKHGRLHTVRKNG